MSKKKARGDSKRNLKVDLTFSDLSLSEEQRSIFSDVLETQAGAMVAAFPALLAKLDTLLRTKSPTQMIAALAYYGLQTGVTESGTELHSLLPSVAQHHVELLQALALRIPENEWGHNILMPDDTQAVIDTVTQLADAFHQRRFLDSRVSDDLTEKTVKSLSEKLRLHRQLVRNWGYFSNVVRISNELYEPLNAGLQAKHGFSATDIITVGVALVKRLELLHTDRLLKIRKIMREKKLHRIVRKYYELFPSASSLSSPVLPNFPPGFDPNMLRTTILAHLELSLATLATTDAADISERTGLPIATAKFALDRLSVVAGQLSTTEPEHLFLNNPIWTAPGVRQSGRYFFAVPQVVFSFIHDLMRTLAEEAGHKAVLEERRAVYLESKVRDILISAIPNCEYVENVKWKLGGVEYETDLIIKIDRTLIIAESKSAALTPAGLRGAPDRIKRN
ncbi:hypothetical protein LJR231_002697 [Phyllobacterium sp. LjRoot231]|uniref:hypothetical protein n=1 Tax=Phyllobacterium sp. LjRoot231 TaxID=3342289 RepID=UPI003ECED63A